MTNKLILGFTFALLLGCQGGWDKNPRLEGLPPEVEQEPPTFMAAKRDAIFILNENSYELVEGQEDATIEFPVRVLQEDIQDIQVEIPNLQDYLTGATYSFDPQTNLVTIKWDVPQVFVRGVENPSVSYDLGIVVHTLSKDQSRAMRSNPVEFKILRKLDRPEIVSVSQLGNVPNPNAAPTLKENSTVSLKVVVRDPNASNGRVTVAAPLLIVEPAGTSGRGSGHHLMEVANPTQDSSDPALWNFTVRIVTTGLEITNNRATFQYGLRAYTPMGMANPMLRSTVHTGSFTVVTNIGTIAYTGGHRVGFREGGRNSLTIVFYDPRGEGKAVVDQAELKKSCGAKGADCICESVGDNVRCEILWTPGAADADPRRDVEHKFEFKAHLEHKVTGEKSDPKVFGQTIHVMSK